MQTELFTQFNQLNLSRYPKIKDQRLQAWDAADEYLLQNLYSQKTKLKNKNILIFNDSFGALTLALNEYKPVSMTDSIISELAIKENSRTNTLHLEQSSILASLTKLDLVYDYVLIKAPKSLDYLRYFLAKIGDSIHNETQIIVAGMIKAMPKTVWTILQEMLGETTTSLAQKKARLIHVKPTHKKSTTSYPIHFFQENSKYIIYNHANVFSKKSLDIGTRFLLQNLPKFNSLESIIDLGCGNGIVGLNLAIAYPQAKVIFTDESYMAVASAKLTAESNLENIAKHLFVTNNCLDGFDQNSSDLIVCNPPFHQSHTIGLHIALQMFQQSYQTLRTKGHFVVIANRHLPYYSHLKRIFGNVINHANNRKFSVFLMRKS